jgi:hypothetical protein
MELEAQDLVDKVPECRLEFLLVLNLGLFRERLQKRGMSQRIM